MGPPGRGREGQSPQGRAGECGPQGSVCGWRLACVCTPGTCHGAWIQGGGALFLFPTLRSLCVPILAAQWTTSFGNPLGKPHTPTTQSRCPIGPTFFTFRTRGTCFPHHHALTQPPSAPPLFARLNAGDFYKPVEINFRYVFLPFSLLPSKVIQWEDSWGLVLWSGMGATTTSEIPTQGGYFEVRGKKDSKKARHVLVFFF